jgi:hypothetical protein
MTFEEFTASRRRVNNIGWWFKDSFGFTLYDDGRAGYVYRGDFYISCSPDGDYEVIYLDGQTVFPTLASAESCLWDCLKDEING